MHIMKNGKNVYIIGAGVAGLIAALHLEEAGFSPTILENSDRPGGRVKTDTLEGFRLDLGFQVLLTQYREARHYLNFEELKLRRFAPGAVVFSGGRRFRISDPLRDPSRLFEMAFSPVGSLADKFRMWRLTEKLKKRSVEDLFPSVDTPTLEYLENLGFSQRIIQQFFRPFFGGIFLENELRTPAAMFRFVFKMFSEGDAAIPAEGIGEIPFQLRSRLERTRIRYHCPVELVEGQEIILKGGERLPFDRLIIATDPSSLLQGLKGQSFSYTSTTNLYFKAKRSPLQSPTIALVADTDNPINNFCALTDVSPAYGPQGSVLLSVSLKEGPSPENAEQRTLDALSQLTRMPQSDFEFIKRYDIPRALPALDDLHYDLQPMQTRLTDTVFTAGDHLLNASLDAAMRSGRRAAEAVLQSF
jgi:phytoene dehydrogenase-like protein